MRKKASLERFLKASEYAVDRSFANNSFLHLPRKTDQKYPNPVRRSLSKYDHVFQQSRSPTAHLPPASQNQRRGTSRVDQETQARGKGPTPTHLTSAALRSPQTITEPDIRTVKLRRESTEHTEA